MELCRRRNFSFAFHPVLSRAELGTRSLTCSPARLVDTAVRWPPQLCHKVEGDPGVLGLWVHMGLSSIFEGV